MEQEREVTKKKEEEMHGKYWTTEYIHESEKEKGR